MEEREMEREEKRGVKQKKKEIGKEMILQKMERKKLWMKRLKD